MQVVRDMAGYSLGRSDLMRRAMSKKEAATMEKERHIFVHGLEENGTLVVPGAVRLGVDAQTAEKVFDQISSFAAYAFNKAHAACYAVVAYQTAYLKHYYPSEFMAAMLNSFLGDGTKAALYIQYCRDKGIKVLPPHINQSGESFTVDSDGSVRFGMAAIKNVGVSAAQAIVRERERNGKFEDLYDFANRVVMLPEVNKRSVECLIKAGALDNMGSTRRALVMAFEQVMESAASGAKRQIEGQISFFSMDDAPELPKETVPHFPEYDPTYILSMEKEMLGVYISGHPLDKYTDIVKRTGFNTAMLQPEEEGQISGAGLDNKVVECIGVVSNVRTKVTKSGNMLAFVSLEDLYGTLEVMLFPKVYQKYSSILVPESILSFKGRISAKEDEMPKLLADTISTLDASDSVEPPQTVYIRIMDHNADFASDLDDIIAGYPGKDSVILYFPTLEGGSKKLLNSRIKYSLAKAVLEAQFGAENVKAK